MGQRELGLMNYNLIRMLDFRYTVPSGCLTEHSTIGASLGLYGLRVKDLKDLFNTFTLNHYPMGTPLSVQFHIVGRLFHMSYRLSSRMKMFNNLFLYSSNKLALIGEQLNYLFKVASLGVFHMLCKYTDYYAIPILTRRVLINQYYDVTRTKELFKAAIVYRRRRKNRRKRSMNKT
jgi:hypothetical protein